MNNEQVHAALLEYFNASTSFGNTVGHEGATPADEHKAEVRFEAAGDAVRCALATSATPERSGESGDDAQDGWYAAAEWVRQNFENYQTAYDMCAAMESAAPDAATVPDASSEAVRQRFEFLANDSYGFKRSRKGNYVNASVARDWKWFRLGIEDATRPAPAASSSAAPSGQFSRKGASMTNTETIKALRDALTEMIAQVELHAPQSLQRVDQSDLWVRNDYSQKAIDSAKAKLALTADASEDAPGDCRRCRSYATLVKAKESQLAHVQAEAAKGREAIATLASEREANAMLTAELAARPAPVGAEQVPEGWQLVPIDPTETMVIDGFESRPDWGFTPYEEMEKYEAMSGCRQAAHRARLCYAAMLAAAPSAPAITGNVLVSRATLEMIYDAMNHMGDQLNEMDVVEADDEKVFPAFDLIRDLMAKPAAPAAPITKGSENE